MRILLVVLIFLLPSISFSANFYYFGYNVSPIYFSLSSSEICNHSDVKAYVESLWHSPVVSATSSYCPGPNCSCNFVFENNVETFLYINYISCPANAIPSQQGNAAICVACSSGQVLNPYTGQCQAPCDDYSTPESEYPPELNPGSVSVGVGAGSTCDNGCLTEYFGNAYEDSAGFSRVFYTASRQAGVMCAVGSRTEPPADSGPTCDPPKELQGNVCMLPCPAWQQAQGGQCVDKPCSDGKLLKCGQVNGTEICSCVGLTDCEPGYVKNAFGNCIAEPSCPEGQKMNSVTGVCEADSTEPDCPSGTHREGLMCVKDEEQCQAGTWYIPGCGCVSDINQCPNRDSNDLDGDGIPNNRDSDVDGDGKPNASDDDADGDGIPNKTDSTPDGPVPPEPETDPNDTDGDGIPNDEDDTPLGPNPSDPDPDDRDGDGIPNDQDATPDGPNDPGLTHKPDPADDLDNDGIPNAEDSDRDGDGIPNEQDATPDGRKDGDGDTGVGDGQCNPETEDCGNEGPGSPAAIEAPFYKKKEGRDFQTIWSAFISRVQKARIVTAGADFFSGSIGSGSCPNWEIPATAYFPSIPITLQCSSEVSAALRIAGIAVLVVAAWLAFRIALL